MRADFDFSDRLSDPISARESTSHNASPNDAIPQKSRNFYCDIGKPLLDFSIAILAIIFFLPFFTIIAVAIKASDQGPVFFSHSRVGRGGRSFPCYKFRTMVPNANDRLDLLLATDPDARSEWDNTQKLKNDPRITAVGEFLRKTSLDELPQLFNVLRGEMAIIGPRPITTAETKHYGEYLE